MSTSATTHNTCGTCSICGGAVTVPSIWGAVIPPIPTCQQCGAIPVETHGPVIKMQPVRRIVVTNTGNSALVFVDGTPTVQSETWLPNYDPSNTQRILC